MLICLRTEMYDGAVNAKISQPNIVEKAKDTKI